MSTTIALNSENQRLQQHSLLTQFLDLFLIELTNWRWAWVPMLIQGTITPLFSLVALGIFARDSGTEALVYVVTGNIVVGLLFGTMNGVQSHFTWLRFDGAMDYFATLPITRYVFILAIALAFLLLSIPSLLVTMILGPILLGIPLNPSPLVVVVVLFCALSMAGTGALLGLFGRTRTESLNLGFLFTLVLTALGPVVVPPSHLPKIMVLIGYLVPTTYAASALRQSLVGPLTERIVVDLIVLGGVTVLFLWVAGNKMNWRQE